MNYIPDAIERDLRKLIECKGGAGKKSIGTDYFVYDRMFSIQFLKDLTEEMKRIEKVFEKEFIDSKLIRNNGKTDENDYTTYHRISKVFWLQKIKEPELNAYPALIKFQQWAKLLEASINK